MERGFQFKTRVKQYSVIITYIIYVWEWNVKCETL